MTWEILLGLLTLVGALVTVGGVVVKVNGTLVRLDKSIEQLNKYIEEQSRKNERFFARLDDHERRIQRIEDRRGESAAERSDRQ